jgi:hypothetical protein
MSPRYRAAMALTLAFACALPAAARARRHAHHRRQNGSSPPVSVRDLYSSRALRRARTILELKLLELRSEHLERIRKALEKHARIDDLLKTP